MKNRFFRVSLMAPILLSLLSSEGVAQVSSSSRSPVNAVASDTLSTEQERFLIDLLDTNFQSLADNSRRGRHIGGYVLLGLGIGSGLGGAATLAFGEGDDAQIVGYSLMGGGVLLSGLSLIPFKVRGEVERAYNEFNRVPADTPDEVHHKHFYWDRRFEELAEKRRRDRIIGGVSSIIIGGVTGIVALSGSDEGNVNAFIWPALGPILGGVTSLLTKSETERRYETYRRAKADFLGHTTGTEVRFGIIPLPKNGMLATVQVRF